MSFACNILRALGFCLLLAAYLNAQPSPYRYFGQQPGERYGSAVAFLGDIDGDGDDEIAIGAPWYSGNYFANGRVEVRRRRGGVIYQSFGFGFAEQFGATLDSVPDVDGDGVADLLVGAWGDSSLGLNTGRVYLLSGATGNQIWTQTGTSTGDRFGFDVAYAGDTHGTGIPSVIIGAPGHNNDTGAAFILSATNGSVLHMITPPHPSGHFGHSVSGAGDINAGVDDDVIIGAPFTDTNGMDSGQIYFADGLTASIIAQVQGQSGSLLGFCVSGFADVTGDGRNDYLAGAPWYTSAGLPSGRGFLRESLNNGAAPIVTLSGTQVSESFGSQIAPAGDRNGDGLLSVICGGPGWDGPLGINQGRVVIHDENSQQLFLAEGGTAGEEFGSAIASRGDYNGDGRPDVIVGAPRYDPGPMTDAGSVVVYAAEGAAPYGSDLGGLNTIDLTTSGGTNSGEVLHLVVSNGPASGPGQIGLSLNPANLTVTLPGGPLTLLLELTTLAPTISYTHDAAGAFSLGFYILPSVIAVAGGSTLYAQVGGFDPVHLTWHASNGMALTFGY